jgi:WD40 repeat protein
MESDPIFTPETNIESSKSTASATKEEEKPYSSNSEIKTVKNTIPKKENGEDAGLAESTSLKNNAIKSSEIDENMLIVRLSNMKIHLENQFAHEEEIWSAIFIPELQFICTSSSLSKIKIWDSTSLEHIDTLLGHSAAIRGLVYLGRSKLASCCDDLTIKIWNLSAMEETQTLTGHYSHIFAVILLSNGYLLSGSYNYEFIIWKLNHSDHYEFFGKFTFPRQQISFCMVEIFPGLIAASSSANIHIYSLKITDTACEYKYCFAFRGHKAGVKDIKLVGQDKQYMLSGSFDNSCKLWSLSRKVSLKTFTGHTRWVMNLLTVTPTVFVSVSNEMKIWKLFSGECTTTAGTTRLYKVCRLLDDQIMTVTGKSLQVWKF